MLDDNNAVNSSVNYLLKLAFASEKNGLETGIRWGLPAKLVDAINNALTTQQFDAPVKIGWDPTHVQPVGIAASDAKTGKRPL